MTLCELTREWDGTKVYINGAQVVLVVAADDGSGTRIVTTAGENDGPHSVTVTETIKDVVSRLNLHMNG